jgi:CRP/FNR family transcriptional regulator, cyclic AMP receptor protein
VFAATTEKVSALPPVKFKKGERIFWKHDAADAIFRVQAGIVGYSVSSSNGKEALLALLGPCNFFGDRHLAGLRSRTCSAAALTDCILQRFDKHSFLRYLSEDRLAMETFIGQLVERNLEYESDLCGHLFHSSEDRLRQLLLKLCRLGNRKGSSVEIPVRLTHDMMAQIVGTTRSRVTFFMNKFRREGLVEYGRTLIVHAAPPAEPVS